MLRTVLCLIAVLLLCAACGATEPPELTTTGDGHQAAQVAHLRPTHRPVESTTTTTAPPTTTTTEPPPSTTTTMPPSPPATQQVQTLAQPQQPAGDWGAEGTVNGYPCGGRLPTCQVLRCESGGNPTAENPSSSASGLWQILDGTWAGFGGYARASHAPPSVQNEKAAQLWDGGAGRFHWSSCL